MATGLAVAGYVAAAVSAAATVYSAVESSKASKASTAATKAASNAAAIKARQERLAALRQQQKARAAVIAQSSSYGGNVSTSGVSGTESAMTTAGDINTAFTNQISSLNQQISSKLQSAASYTYRSNVASAASTVMSSVSSASMYGSKNYDAIKSTLFGDSSTQTAS